MILCTEAVVHFRGYDLRCGLHYPSYCATHIVCWGHSIWFSSDVNCVILWMRDESECIVVTTHQVKLHPILLDVVFWPGMGAQIEDTVSSCSTCSKYQRKNTKEPLLPHSAPSRPWERVGTDLCELNGRHYLVLVDYYSNFIEFDHLKETTSEKVIEFCKSQFARHGIPDIVISDNGPQFSSEKF